MAPEEQKDVAAIERFLGRTVPRVLIPDFDYKAQPTTKLDTYSLADPSNPQFLGTTGDIPYASATEMVVTDTHVFVAFVNLINDSGSRAVLAQTGGVFVVGGIAPRE